MVPEGSWITAAALTHLEGQIGPNSPRKTEIALGLFELHVDTAELTKRIELSRSERVTPMMFEHELLERARAARRHIVLPEGTEDRMLRAAEVLLRRNICDLTLLGAPDTVHRRAAALGIELPQPDDTQDRTQVRIVDPATSPLRRQFAELYAKLRAHRGMTVELALDVVTDVSYFGTLMVQEGIADGMVSGSVHSTAATIRPAFEVIKTAPDAAIVSSVFFMCLADRVLVYGDCAVNPDPDARQLADIAIQSAETAAQFGVEPRVAMLSYSTGTSGSGVDVDKVRRATELVRELRPDLPVDGPIQYDAAVDAHVAATKMPGSPVAGRATVLIFPDLNTGNNTYKAVQRSAGAVAVGPVLQGLRKPVNDLSRGRWWRTSSTPSRSPPCRPRPPSRPGPPAKERPGECGHPGPRPERGLVLGQVPVDRHAGRRPAGRRPGRAGRRTRRPAGAHPARRRAARGPAALRGPRRGPGGRRRGAGCGRARPGLPELAAIGHRVVHGGRRFTAPTLITDEVLAEVRRLVPVAPLHNPANITGIEVARRLRPDLPQVAVFDTAFHATLPEYAARYAIDRAVADEHRVRRYGFHGTSHQYVSRAAAALLGKEPAEVNVIVLHLGNGASASAVAGGVCVETSMGLTPLEGLVMGTRSGDVDPGVVFHLHRVGGLTIDEIDALLNRRSGLLGLCGDNDMREILRRRGEGDADAALAFDAYVHRLRKYLGAYYAVLGRVDAVVFTAGVGRTRRLSGRPSAPVWRGWESWSTPS